MERTSRNIDNRYNEPKRGGCLDVYLAIFIIFQFVSFCGQFDTIVRIQRYTTPHTMLYVLMFMRLGAVVSTFALLNWKKWGYNGLIIFYVIVVILNFSSEAILMGIINSVELIIFWFLVNSVKDYLE